MEGYNDSTRLIDLTVGQFKHLYSSCERDKNNDASVNGERRSSRRLVYGLKGICDLLHCSHKSAQFYKDHIISDAVSQTGRKIVVDADYALELFAQNKKK